MTEYFPFIFIIKSKEYYCIWYSNECNGFITESNRMKYFDNMQQLYWYSNKNNLYIHEGKTVLSIDYAIVWLQQEEKVIDCVYFLDFWNTISDLAYSVDEKFYGNESNTFIRSIYDKLFYGNNLPAMKQDGETFVPKWTIEQINELTAVVKDGLRLINAYLR